MNAPRQPLVEQAREAAECGEWQQAHGLLQDADAGASLGVSDLALLADVAYAAGHLDVTLNTWERIHTQCIQEGDHLGAARAAVRLAMHLLCDTSMMAPVRGWISRAERVLEGHGETPAHAWVAVLRGYDRLFLGDFQAAREWARKAIDIGSRCEPAAAAMGRLTEARGLILDGHVSQGLELMNEAAVVTVSGELDPFMTGIVYCELICAMQALGQYDLAEQWTEAMDLWGREHAVGGIHGRCRVHKAEILRLRGSCDEAEQEAIRACEELRPFLRRELGWPLTELGRIRLNRGDLQGAEDAFLAAHEAGWDPQPGLALVYLARGDIDLAGKFVQDALDHPLIIVSKEYPPNTALRRAPLLEALVRIKIASGDLDPARGAAEELSRIAALFGSEALAASAALGRGRVALAESDPASAKRLFLEAARLWTGVGAPYETSVARMALAHAYEAEGDDQRAAMEFRAARSGFEQAGAVHQAAEAARACRGELHGETPEAGGTSPEQPAAGTVGN
ncbi:MAG: transcriptional regulator, partial [Dehalococcoidia bacterium]